MRKRRQGLAPMTLFPTPRPLVYVVVIVIAVIIAASSSPTLAAPAGLTVVGKNFKASFDRGSLISLSDAQGNVFVSTEAKPQGVGIHRMTADHWAGASKMLQAWADGRATEEYGEFSGLPRARVTAEYVTDAESGDLVVTQKAESPEKGVWGVEWAIEGIPNEMNILVPGNSGLKFTRTSPETSMTFDYPMSWEAQLVIIEGAGRGFCVWAEDAKGIFKRLTLERTDAGWRLGFITMPFAPFEERSACESVRWHLNVYEGDWRVSARRYRDWAERVYKPTRVEAQRPSWARDIRCCVIMGQDLDVLEALPARIDPKQTLLYLPAWRTAGYDRDYPTYDQVVDTLDPFLARAHELGFRVMLHVNYFGCDPLNPLYAQFEPYQVRSPWGAHEKEWWLWTRADPVIKFAYINPACKAWRGEQVSRLATLCKTHGVDALHLDQTLCIYNDYNGLIDGMSMIEGNVALHRELREAIPDVALSGEGLDEVTCRYEAFAQRHAMGLNHADGTFNLLQLRMAHPISSYLLRPYTTMYGYLGYAPPTDTALYCAWNEAYRYWGIIPTLKPALGEIKNPSGFSAQFFDEAAFWLRERVDVDMDAPWPTDVTFPFKTANGERVVRTDDRRLVWKDKAQCSDISRTITGVTQACFPGSIPAWRAYDADCFLGLDPGSWYPCSPEPRDLKAFHVASPLPDGFTIAAVAAHESLAFVRTRPASNADIHLVDLMPDAVCGSKSFDAAPRDGAGAPTQSHGSLHAADGAMFYATGDALYAHPPWHTAGSGIAYARFSVNVPKNVIRFTSEVAMESEAVGEGKTDGVTYGATVRDSVVDKGLQPLVPATVRDAEHEAHAELHQATSEKHPLSLDLKPFAGKAVTLELTVHPGPKHNPSFDWARWYGPRIERDLHAEADMTIVDSAPWALALSGTHVKTLGEKTTFDVPAVFPGAVFLLRTPLPIASLPLDMAAAPRETTFVSDAGMVLQHPLYACAQPGESVVGGVTRAGLFEHPPDHGRTYADFPMTLPDRPVVFHAWVGIRDGSKSTGADFIVEANGVRLYGERILPGAWHEVTCDLSPWTLLPVVLSLIADSAGDFNCDWTHWGEPQIREK